MKRIISFLLCAVMFAFLATSAFADSYSSVSDKNVKLEYPEEKNYFAEPFEATVKASRKNGSIYIMPKAEAGNGHLGTVPNGETVLIMAEQSGYYFFMTEEGYCGWNGKNWFETDNHAEEKLSVSNKSSVSNNNKTSASAGSYSYISDEGVKLQYPKEKYFFSEPFEATVKASRKNGSIYIMPKAEAGNGHLGTVPNGETVLIMAEQSGYYFFMTEEAYCGWNGKKWFETDKHAEEKVFEVNKSTVSDKGVDLEYPEDKDYYSTPFVMLVKSSRSDGHGSIYLMPKPEAGNGNLGTVKDGNAVLILAERSGYYFFQTDDGRQGWNGKNWFE